MPPADAGPARPRGAVAAELVPDVRLSPLQRRTLLDDVYQDVVRHYYDPTLRQVPLGALRRQYLARVDAAPTTASVYQVLDEFVGQLADAHTRVRSPLERQLRERHQSLSLGIALQDLGSTIAVSRVVSDEARAAGLMPGDRLVAIDGQSVDELLAQALRSEPSSSTRASRLLALRGVIRHAAAQPRLTVERLDGTRVDAVLTRTVVDQPPRVTVAREDEVLVLGWNQFRGPIRATVAAALRTHAEARAVVVDLRGNGGGSLQEALAIADLFTPHRLPFGRQVARAGASRLRRVPSSSEGNFDGPLVILVDAASASASETFAAALQEAGRAVVVGETTCGCVLVTTSPRPLPGGGELSVSEYDYFTPAGRRLEGQGVRPDWPVRVTRDDLAAGRDPARDAALATARELVARASTGRPHTPAP
ncbi:MAG: hypothetical protein H0V80_16485 [Acidobacteria bacterium]|nr:hypothetical protein [Acidobacteriota bacterium]